jgi:hypothetical protein
MELNTIASLMSVAGVIFAYFSFLREKLNQAEQFGELKQKVRTLENQAQTNENRFQTIESKLDTIQMTLTQVDTSLKNLINHRNS